MISIELLSGEIYQNIYPTENCVKYSDLIKHIKKPKDPRFEEYDKKKNHVYSDYQIVVSTSLRFIDKKSQKKINLKDNIDFDNVLILWFKYRYAYVLSSWHIEIKNPEKVSNNPDDIIKNPILIAFIKNQTHELCRLAIEGIPMTIRYIYHENLTHELCELAVNKASLTLKFVPDCFKTLELCEKSVSRNIRACKYFPPEFLNEKCEYFLEKYTYIRLVYN